MERDRSSDQGIDVAKYFQGVLPMMTFGIVATLWEYCQNNLWRMFIVGSTNNLSLTHFVRN